MPVIKFWKSKFQHFLFHLHSILQMAGLIFNSSNLRFSNNYCSEHLDRYCPNPACTQHKIQKIVKLSFLDWTRSTSSRKWKFSKDMEIFTTLLVIGICVSWLSSFSLETLDSEGLISLIPSFSWGARFLWLVCLGNCVAPFKYHLHFSIGCSQRGARGLSISMHCFVYPLASHVLFMPRLWKDNMVLNQPPISRNYPFKPYQTFVTFLPYLLPHLSALRASHKISIFSTVLLIELSEYFSNASCKCLCTSFGKQPFAFSTLKLKIRLSFLFAPSQGQGYLRVVYRSWDSTCCHIYFHLHEGSEPWETVRNDSISSIWSECSTPKQNTCIISI